MHTCSLSASTHPIVCHAIRALQCSCSLMTKFGLYDKQSGGHSVGLCWCKHSSITPHVWFPDPIKDSSLLFIDFSAILLALMRHFKLSPLLHIITVTAKTTKKHFSLMA